MKIIAGVHADYAGTMQIDGQRGALPLRPRRAERRHRHGASGAQHRARPLGRRERLPRHAADEPVRRRRLAAHGARGARASRRPRHRRRSARAHRLAADRPAAADRDRPRAVLRRAHHHPRRADLGALAAGGRAAVRACSGACRSAASSIIFISHFLDDILRISDEVTIFRNGRKIVTSPVDGHRQELGHRADDRHGPRGARGKLHRRVRADSQAGRAGGAGSATGLTWRGACSDVSLDVRAGEMLGIYGFMGCGVARAGARALRQDQAGRGALALDGEALKLATHRDGAARRHRLRAGKPPLDALPPRAGLQERVDQHPRAHLEALAEAATPSARSPRGMSTACTSRPPASMRCSAISPAATSRRWRWRNG